jgi:proteic killer suppression protein
MAKDIVLRRIVDRGRSLLSRGFDLNRTGVHGPEESEGPMELALLVRARALCSVPKPAISTRTTPSPTRRGGLSILHLLRRPPTVPERASGGSFLSWAAAYIVVGQLEIAFLTRALRKLCEHQAAAERELGNRVAGVLRRRVADLRAATSIGDLVAGRPCKVGDGHQQVMAVTLAEGFRMVFAANHYSLPLLESGGVDWSAVNRVKVLRIEKQP